MKTNKNIVVFCGAHDHSKYSPVAYSVGKSLAENGFTTITGGGSGMMEQVNKGAFEAKGMSIGICIGHPSEKPNPYLTSSQLYQKFDLRHNALIKLGDAFIVLPGGFGTILEALEITQKKKFHEISAESPLIFLGAYFEKQLAVFDWMKAEGFISEQLSDLYSYANSVDEALVILKNASS